MDDARISTLMGLSRSAMKGYRDRSGTTPFIRGVPAQCLEQIINTWVISILQFYRVTKVFGIRLRSKQRFLLSAYSMHYKVIIRSQMYYRNARVNHFNHCCTGAVESHTLKEKNSKRCRRYMPKHIYSISEFLGIATKDGLQQTG